MTELLKNKKTNAQTLWTSYIKETDTKKATENLKARSKIMDEVFRIQSILIVNLQINE